MYLLFLLGFCSFLISLALTPICQRLFSKWQLVDHPDQDRKLHLRPIPRVGGIPITISYGAAYLVLLLIPFGKHFPADEHIAVIWKLIPAAGLVFIIGLIDDLIGLKAWYKLAFQVTAAILAYAAGVRVTGFVGYPMGSWWSVILTIFWLIACTNAFNLIDGVDGLAAGLGLFAVTTMLVAAFLQNNIALMLATIPLAGSLLAFLRYNFNPATIFLGDSGSLLIGFLLGCYGVIWSQKSATLLGMTAPLIALAIPLLEVGLTVTRRFLRNKPIFGPDRDHIHHRLLDRGFTPRRVALLLYGISSLFAVFSVFISMMLYNRYTGFVLILFCMVAWIGVRDLGYAEFRIAHSMLLRGGLPRMVSAELALEKFGSSLARASTRRECWEVLRLARNEFGFSGVQFAVAGETYTEQAQDTDPSRCWQIHIPLTDSDYVELTRQFHCPVLPIVIASFADIVNRTLPAKCENWRQGQSYSAPQLKPPILMTQAGQPYRLFGSNL